MTANLAVVGVDAAAVAVLSVPHGIVALKEEQRTAVKVILGGMNVLVLPGTGLGKSFVNHSNVVTSASRGVAT